MDGKVCFRKRVSAYSIKSGGWYERTGMHYQRADLCAVVVGDSVYAIGGRQSGDKSEMSGCNYGCS